MKLLVFVTALMILVGSCNTNPPTSPDVTPTGNISLKVRIDNSAAPLPVGKVVLMESFTNVGCYPCPITNRIIRQLSNETYGKSKLVVVKFPVNFPAPNDLFYLAAKEICDFRMSYYDVFYAPTIIIDGMLKPVASDSISIKTAIDARISAEPRFSINVNASLEGDYSVDIAIKIIDSSSINMNDLIINTAITEKDIEFQQPPGSNGETKFYDVIRLMLPSTDGISLRQLIDGGELLFEFEDVLVSDWNLGKLNAVVYIQNMSTKEVYQAGSSFK
ncbi:MAG TPA: Omp28-related outer membrane protein [Ignavibacteriaceae bacterium]|nr:Omp28-related outer membrane protein [Ignavibacteriaceae bacterium]